MEPLFSRIVEIPFTTVQGLNRPLLLCLNKKFGLHRFLIKYDRYKAAMLLGSHIACSQVVFSFLLHKQLSTKELAAC